MYYKSEQEIDNLLQELDIQIFEIDDTFTPTDEDITDINEFYNILE